MVDILQAWTEPRMWTKAATDRKTIPPRCAVCAPGKKRGRQKTRWHTHIVRIIYYPCVAETFAVMEWLLRETFNWRKKKPTQTNILHRTPFRWWCEREPRNESGLSRPRLLDRRPKSKKKSKTKVSWKPGGALKAFQSVTETVSGFAACHRARTTRPPRGGEGFPDLVKTTRTENRQTETFNFNCHPIQFYRTTIGRRCSRWSVLVREWLKLKTMKRGLFPSGSPREGERKTVRKERLFVIWWRPTVRAWPSSLTSIMNVWSHVL